MRSQRTLQRMLVAVAGTAVLFALGCQESWRQYYQRPVAPPLGTISDSVWRCQEANAERSDFLVYEHEFVPQGEFLNEDGQDHVTQIAARLAAGQDAQIMVQRSCSSPDPATKYQYPVHRNSELDMQRREIVVRSLVAMGIGDAEMRVVVAPLPVPNYKAGEVAASYGSGAQGGSGFGGFFFGSPGSSGARF